ncbi:toll-like receptor Tollo [Periplaneta americana]|uniref:toll-like receptor Tollo n=1 Tax=Periplaneta americana TaxID=6978 RepID=UPI0037E843E4
MTPPPLLLLVFAVLTAEARSITSRHEDALKDCVWERVVSTPDAATEDDSASVLLACRLRTIGGTDSLLGNLTATQVERITALRLECSDVLFFESSLENGRHEGFLGQLRRLRDLRIEYCKIRYVPSAVLAALRELRHLSLRTHNTDWSAMTMEFHPDSFRGLAELRSLDLADNNIWTLPSELFCALYSLTHLNLSRNRLQDVSEMGFSDWGSGPSAPGKSCNVGLEVLDLSANDIIVMPDNGLSSLRSLQKLYIQDNSLTSMADRALVGLTSLQILNSSSNLLVALPPELFQSSRDLKEIYLQNNSISVLAPGLLEGLDQLLVLDLSSNELTSNWVNRDTFSGLVRLVVLNLAHNEITRIDPHVFQDLYSLQMLNLEENGIEVIMEGAFSTLSNLHALTLTHNNLVRLESYHFTGLYVLNQLFLDNNRITTIHPRTFENCTNLQDLGISGNALTEVPEGIGQLRYLKTLDLGENHISKFSNTSFEGLDQLYGLRLIDNELVNISRDAFSALPSLQVLNLACNKIQVVDQGAFGTNPTLRAIRLDGNVLTNIDGVFTHLPGLVWLNVSDNQLTWFDYALLPQSLEWLDMHKNKVSKLGNYFDIRNELQIKMLDVSFNKLTEIGEVSIPNSVESVFLNDNMIKKVQPNTFLKKVNLSRVVLYANELENLDFGALRLQPVPDDRDLPQFYIGGNPFHCDCTMEWLHRINQLSHLRQHPRVMDLDTVTCRLSYSRGEMSRPLLDLKPSQFLCPYETHCFALCHCCDFDACDCEMTCPDNCTCYHDHTWSANVVDCSNGGHRSVPAKIPMDATEIYLDGNDLGELGSHVFIGKKKLQVLYLNGSNVAAIHNRTFNGVTSLRVLHLENNRLQELRGFEFDQLENLNELYLDHNAISHVGNTTFSAMRSLEVLRLDENKIVNFSPWQQLAAAAGSLAQVSLDGNTWTCDCDSVSRLEEWLRENKDATTGSDPSKMMCTTGGDKKTNENIADFIKRCHKDSHNAVATSVVQRNPLFNNTILSDSYVPLLAASLAVIVVVFLVSTLIFIFRQDVRLWAHSRYGIRIFSDSTPAAEIDDDRDRLYDAYMVYSIKDEDFISRVITCELEQSGYSMCLHYRDIHLMGGTSYLADSVLSASDASRRIIIVLSLSFLQNEWDRPEFRASLQASLEQTRMALRRNKVIFLLTTDLQTLNLDPDLQILLRTCTVISWGEKRFWEKLRYAMPDVLAVKKKIKKGRKSSSVAVNDLKKKVGRDGEAGKTASKTASARYTAAPTSLDSWYKYSHPQQPSAPLHQAVPTPTPTQSTYVSENSSQRTTDHEEEEEESSTTTNGSQHYEYSEHHNKHSYTAVDARHPHHHHHHRSHHHHHVYSTIPDSIPLTHHHSRSSTSSGDPTDSSGNYPAAVCKLNNAGDVAAPANGRTYFV